jgi:antitoxin component of MazEF toxin-antitoxin module
MVVTLKKSGDTFTFTLPPQAAEDLSLVDGSTIDVQPTKVPQSPTIRYASVSEVMEAHREMEPRHAEAYRELAK